MDTPPNHSHMAATLAAAAKTTPVTAKLADRNRGIDCVRACYDDTVTMEDRWLDVDFDKFKAKLPGGDFHLEEHVEDMILDIEPFDVKGTQAKDENATYPILVSVSSLSPLALANTGRSLT